MKIVRAAHRGMTLVEVILVLAIMGTVTAMTLTRISKSRVASAARTLVTTARTEAIQTFRPVTRWTTIAGNPVSFTALPDGSIIADSAGARHIAIDRSALGDTK